MTPDCGARYPTGLDRCSLAHHDNKTKHKDGSTGREWGGKRKANPLSSRSGSSLKPGKGPNPRSEKQEIRTAFLMGVKAERLRAQIDQRGEPFCQKCNRLLSTSLYGSPEYDSDAEYVEACMAMLDLHHKVERTKGHGYSGPSDHGVDSPYNLALLCRLCHQKEGSNPEFSSSERGEAG